MRVSAWFVALALGCGLSAALTVQAADEIATAARVQQLVTQLGSNKFTEREEASKALDTLGASALGALKSASVSPDLEVKRRAAALVKKIEARLESEKLLAPSRVRLKLRDVFLTEAVQELARKSGHTIVLQGPPSAYQRRIAALDTGETTFWEALDSLCRQAQLCESKSPPANDALLVAQRRAELEQNEALLRQLARVGGLVPQAAPPPRPSPAATAAAAATARGEAQTFSPAGTKTNGIPVILSGGSSDLPTCYCGAVRIRVSPKVFRAGDKHEAILHCDVAAEPTLQALQIRSVRVDRAEDEKGQALSVIVNETPARADSNQIYMSGNTSMPLSLRTLARDQASVHVQQTRPPAVLLKEFTGSISAVVQTSPQTLITVDDVQKSVGKTINGPSGGSIKVNDFTANNRQITARLEVEVPSDQEAVALAAVGNQLMAANLARLNLQRRAVIGGQVAFSQLNSRAAAEGLTLYDDKGQPFPPPQISLKMRAVNNVVTQECTAYFRPGSDQGAPAKLVYKGPRTSTVEIPFSFRDLKLP